MKIKTSLLLMLSIFFCAEILFAQTFYNSYSEIPDAGVFAKITDDGYRLTHYSTSFLGATNYKYVEVDDNDRSLTERLNELAFRKRAACVSSLIPLKFIKLFLRVSLNSFIS